MSYPKQHHYVTRAYLKFFLDQTLEPPGIWMVDLDDLRIVRTTPGSVVKQNHYYSFMQNDELNTGVEDLLSIVEANALPILYRINNWEFNLSNEDREHVAIFLAFMILRVPKMRSRVEDLNRDLVARVAHILMTHPGALEKTARDMGNTDEVEIQKEANQLRDFWATYGPKVKISIDPVVSLRAMLETYHTITHYLRQMQWTILVNLTDAPFITSDNPVAVHDPRIPRKSPYGPGLALPQTEVSVPVGPNHCLFLAYRELPEFIPLDPSPVWEINSRTQGYCRRFTFASSWIGAYRSLEGRKISKKNREVSFVPDSDDLRRSGRSIFWYQSS